jgi:hypothetical protein
MTMEYDQEQYATHLAAIEKMREELIEKLGSIDGYPLMLQDAAGQIPMSKKEEPPPFRVFAEDVSSQRVRRRKPSFEPPPSPNRVIVDLSKGTVEVVSESNLSYEHEFLERLAIPHDYHPLFGSDCTATVGRISLSIDHAVNHLSEVIKRAAEITPWIASSKPPGFQR